MATLAQLVAAQKAAKAAPKAPPPPRIQRALTAKKVVKPAPLPAGGFGAALRGKKAAAPNTGLMAITGRLPGQRDQTTPATRAVTAPVRVAGPPAPKPNPKTTSSHTMTGSAAKPIYHTPTPPSAPTRSPGAAAGTVRTPSPAPVPAVPSVPASATTAGRVASAISKVGTGVANAAAGVPSAVTAAPVTAAPPPATAAPAATAASPVAAPAPADPYAAYPPEVAALLRANDETLAAQQGSLSGYFNNQAQAAQDFASAIGTQTGNLAQLAGIPTGTGNLATSGLPGAVTALPGALGTIAQHLGGAQGLSTTNAAASVPGFLRQQGIQSQATLAGAGQASRQKVLSDYIDQQGQLAQTQAEQQGMDARAANQVASNEKIAAARNAVTQADSTLTLLGHVLTAATSSGNAQLAASTRTAISNATIDAAAARAALSANTAVTTAGMRTQATANTAAAKTAATTATSYQKTKSKWASSAMGALQGKQVRIGSHKQGTATVYDYGSSGAEAPQALLTDMLNSGLTPRDAYNITKGAVARLPNQEWKDPQVDFYNALQSSGMATAKALSLTRSITGHDPTGIAGPFPTT